MPLFHPELADLIVGEHDTGAAAALEMLFDHCPELATESRNRKVRYRVFFVRPTVESMLEWEKEPTSIPRLRERAASALARAAAAAEPSSAITEVYVASTAYLAGAHIARFELTVPSGVFAGSVDVGEGGMIFFGANGKNVGSDQWEDARRWLTGFLAQFPAR